MLDFLDKNGEIKKFIDQHKQKLLLGVLVIGGFVVLMLTNKKDVDNVEEGDQLSYKIIKNDDYKEDSIASAEISVNQKKLDSLPKANHDLASSLNDLESVDLNQDQTSSIQRYKPYGDNDMYTVPTRRARERISEPVYQEPITHHYETQTISKTEIKPYSTSKVEEKKEGKEINISVIKDYEVIDGDWIGLKTSEDATINGINIKKGTRFYGTVKESDNKIQIMVKSITLANNKVVRLNAKILSLDGSIGIPILGGNEADDDFESTAKEVGEELFDNTTSKIPIIGSIISKRRSGKAKRKQPTYIGTGEKFILAVY